MDDLFARSLAKLNISITEEQERYFDLYLSELKLFNPVYKLVKYTDEADLITKHFVDSISAYNTIKDLLKSGDTIADLGSGAGFPGIVLAIMFPEHKVYLIERMKRRVDFLTNVVARTGLKNVLIVPEDIENVKEKFNFVTCRAFHPLFDIMGMVDKILATDGIFCAYKAQRTYVESELAQCEGLSYDYSLQPIKVPYLDEERMLCILKRR